MSIGQYRSPGMIARDAYLHAKRQEEYAELEADARQAFDFTTGTWYKKFVPKSLPFSTGDFKDSNEFDNWRNMIRDRFYHKFREEWAADLRSRRPPPPVFPPTADEARAPAYNASEAEWARFAMSLNPPPAGYVRPYEQVMEYRGMESQRIRNKLREDAMRRPPLPPAPENAAQRAQMETDARKNALEAATQRNLYPPRTTAGRRRRKKSAKRKSVRRRRV